MSLHSIFEFPGFFSPVPQHAKPDTDEICLKSFGSSGRIAGCGSQFFLSLNFSDGSGVSLEKKSAVKSFGSNGQSKN